MNVLLACNHSAALPDAFATKGHYVLSVDLRTGDHDHDHYQGSIFDIDFYNFDLMIACPPCTYLSNVCGANRSDPSRILQAQFASHFFLRLYHAPVKMVCIENPSGLMNGYFRKPDMVLNPYNFGESERKRSCFWLKNLPPLIMGVQANKAARSFTRSGAPRYFIDTGTRSRHRGAGAHRSIFFKGIANAMAEQWNY
jgi:hypothetical protein